jgi:hypothetical protein
MRLLASVTLPACVLLAALAGPHVGHEFESPSTAVSDARAAHDLRVTWPEVPLARTFATLPLQGGLWNEADPWPLDRARDDAAWSASWGAFADDLVAHAAAVAAASATAAPAAPVAPDRAGERGGEEDVANESASRLARLALAALHQERHADAWRHLADVAAAAPQLAGRLLPHFAPGVPLVHDATLVLPEGLVLRPSLPPPAADGRPPFAPFTVEGLRVGASIVTAQLEVRGDGIDLRYRLDDGPHVSFAAVIPSVPGLATMVEYYDWERADTIGEPLPVVLTEVGEWYRLWGRVRPARPGWPNRVPAAAPQHLEWFGLALLIDEQDPQRAYLEGFAAAAARLLPFDVTVVRPTSADAHGRAHAIDLLSDARRAAKLSDMTSLVARFALGEADIR